jgi:hypothetical protein
MKVYPVHIKILYKSGREERRTIKTKWPEWKKDLSSGKSMGAIKSYVTETEQDRKNGLFKITKNE